VTSLVGVGRRLGEYRETAQRQLNAEKKKRKDGPRVESLIKTLSETHKKITAVEEMMRKLFTGWVFSFNIVRCCMFLARRAVGFAYNEATSLDPINVLFIYVAGKSFQSRAIFLGSMSILK
jgi:hypothetical protein